VVQERGEGSDWIINWQKPSELTFNIKMTIKVDFQFFITDTAGLSEGSPHLVHQEEQPALVDLGDSDGENSSYFCIDQDDSTIASCDSCHDQETIGEAGDDFDVLLARSRVRGPVTDRRPPLQSLQRAPDGPDRAEARTRAFRSRPRRFGRLADLELMEDSAFDVVHTSAVERRRRRINTVSDDIDDSDSLRLARTRVQHRVKTNDSDQDGEAIEIREVIDPEYDGVEILLPLTHIEANSLRHSIEKYSM